MGAGQDWQPAGGKRPVFPTLRSFLSVSSLLHGWIRKGLYLNISVSSEKSDLKGALKIIKFENKK